MMLEVLHFSLFCWCPVSKDSFFFTEASSVAAVLRLGISFKSVEEQVKSMVQSMLENGFNSAAQYAPGQM